MNMNMYLFLYALRNMAAGSLIACRLIGSEVVGSHPTSYIFFLFLARLFISSFQMLRMAL